METVMEGTPHVPIEDAAQELQTTHLRVLMLLKQKVLTGCQADGGWYVERSSLDALKERGIPDAAPPACKTSCTASSCGCKGS
ncbi:MAG TPA: hypothetical protein VI298_05790 [Geobacteraceae bacterium]